MVHAALIQMSTDRPKRDNLTRIRELVDDGSLGLPGRRAVAPAHRPLGHADREPRAAQPGLRGGGQPVRHPRGGELLRSFLRGRPLGDADSRRPGGGRRSCTRGWTWSTRRRSALRSRSPRTGGPSRTGRSRSRRPLASSPRAESRTAVHGVGAAGRRQTGGRRRPRPADIPFESRWWSRRRGGSVTVSMTDSVEREV